MVSRKRWAYECILMHDEVPQFEPFAEDGYIGFRGYVRGKKTGRLYRVTIRASIDTYPHYMPQVFVEPRCGGHWLADGSLCVVKRWSATNTFANHLMTAIKYIEEHDYGY